MAIKAQTVSETDKYISDIQVQEAAKNDLLPGELSAVAIQIGCYIVRIAKRVYQIHQSDGIAEKEIPADDEMLELIRKEMNETSLSWQSEFHIIWEVSAKHISLPNSDFVYIYRAADVGNWSDVMEAIPMLYYRLHTLSMEYDLAIEQLVSAAIKRLLDDVEFVRNLRVGKIALE